MFSMIVKYSFRYKNTDESPIGALMWAHRPAEHLLTNHQERHMEVFINQHLWKKKYKKHVWNPTKKKR